MNFVDLVGQHGLVQDLNLLIDESVFAKRGKQSAGVGKQYKSNAGKVDNCQVGVFGALNAGGLTTLVQDWLFKPSSGISKIYLARQIIHHQL